MEDITIQSNESTAIAIAPSQETSITTIHNLFEKYKEDPYLSAKLHHILCNQLPTMLETIARTKIERQQRIEDLTQEQEGFIQSFLHSNKYFYCQTTEQFFYYDGIHYQVSTEDSILYHILMTINQDGALMSWKQKTKVTIMHKIKDHNVLKSVPESNTIQAVLDLLYPAFFSTKQEAKYFLTIIGDNLLKKTSTNRPAQPVHFISLKSKMFIRELDNMSQAYFGIHIYQSFKHKYHDHDYDQCRMLQIRDSVKTAATWSNILGMYGLDLLCVAAHYSIRYGSSDEYLMGSCPEELIDSILYLKDRSPTDMVQQFMREYLQIDQDLSGNSVSVAAVTTINTISWKNMQYLWKHFLDTHGLPAIMFQTTLKPLMIDLLSRYYQEGNADLPETEERQDRFVGICSKYLPEIQRFLQFWEETIVPDEHETHMEIDEIAALFKRWSKMGGISPRLGKGGILHEKQMMDLIGYYFGPEMEGDKYIHGIRSIQWDKAADIQIAMEQYRAILQAEHDGAVLVPFSAYDAYVFYCQFYSQADSSHMIVNKSYFERAIMSQ